MISIIIITTTYYYNYNMQLHSVENAWKAADWVHDQPNNS